MGYLLGVSPYEVRRLEFQERIWGRMTLALLDRVGARSPWRCLDVGAGVGCVTFPLARRLQPRGRVTALEPSPDFAAYLRATARRSRLKNVDVVNASIADFRWEGPRFDLILLRWVLLFNHDLHRALAPLARLLKPGGYLAVEDYHEYAGMAFHPACRSLAPLVDGAKAWFKAHGGGLDVAGRLPGVYRRLGLDVVEFRPNVLAGDSRSALFQWQWLFFSRHLDGMVRSGGMTRAQTRLYRSEMGRLRRNPDAWFVSPTVFDVVGRR